MPHRRRRPRNVVAALEKERAAWVQELAATSLFYKLFDHLPGVFFFAKDRQGRSMFVSRSILELYQMRDESEMIGLSDFDLNPSGMAEGYVEDDQQLLSGATKQIERLELWFDRQGMPDWFVVTKLPIHDQAGEVCGVMGILRRPEETERLLPVFQTVAKAVDVIRRDFAQPLKVQDVARSCGQSQRQLQRRFQTAFGVSPQEFLIRTRTVAAMRLLEETTLTVAEISERCGFVDASSFTQHLRRRTRMTPLAYRDAAGK
ncbi:MAG: AraC-like DNA-binding protein [Verrucomicrobiales bacterium]|jgi:AraC-like DNA-binding protein